MGNLVRMDMRRLTRSKMFVVSLAVAAALNFIIQFVIPLLSRVFSPGKALPNVRLSDLIVSPFSFPWLLILMLASVVTFSYADIANGYIKNLAGQLPRKSDTIVSKYIVVGIHNCIFMLSCVATNILGVFIASKVFGFSLEADSQIAQSFVILLIKWLLFMGLCSILMFVTTGLKVKTLASVVGVLLGTGSLALVYLGLDQAIKNVFNVNSFTIADYMPDTLAENINVTSSVSTILTAVIVAAVCIVLFMVLTVKVFNSRDVK